MDRPDIEDISSDEEKEPILKRPRREDSEYGSYLSCVSGIVSVINKLLY